MPRAKKPTALKMLAGNPGKRPLPKDEPIYAESDQSPPEWLCERSLELWHTYSLQLAVNGMLNVGNREMLAAYCHLMATYIKGIEDGEEPKISRLQQLRLMAREFGFTPSSQAGVIAPSKAEPNEKDRLFN